MARRIGKWQLSTSVLVVACLAQAAPGFAQFISYGAGSHAILEGNWQSCREDDGRYSERVYDNNLPGIGPFELHLGPYHEFALFRGIQDEHRGHSADDNLLKPYNVEVTGNRAARAWNVNGLHLEVSLGGGSKDECESWFITLTRQSPNPSN